jgi:hypothetical protein
MKHVQGSVQGTVDMQGNITSAENVFPAWSGTYARAKISTHTEHNLKDASAAESLLHCQLPFVRDLYYQRSVYYRLNKQRLTLHWLRIIVAFHDMP